MLRAAYSGAHGLQRAFGRHWHVMADSGRRTRQKHGLDSNLIYIRGGTTAVKALLAGEIHFGHLSPAPMMTAWAQGADFVWII
jgi:hypothetical protein